MGIEKMPELDCFLAIRPLANETTCGDTGVIKEFDNKVFIDIIDGAGHGENAMKVALICRDYLEKNYTQDLVIIMNSLHQQIKTLQRGAVIGLSLLDMATGELEYVGVGNVTARKFGSSSVRCIPRSGIVGYMMPTPREEKMILHDGDVLLLHTDGVKEHFDLDDYPELLIDDAETIATHIIGQFGKEEDDAACIALRYQRRC